LVVTAGAALLTAIAALVTAVLNYLSRPLLIAAREEHSRALQSLLQKWQACVAECNLYKMVTNWEREPAKRDWEIEDEPLFEDLGKHVADCELFPVWRQLKEEVGELEDRRVSLIDSIVTNAKRVVERFRLAAESKHGAQIEVELTEEFERKIYRELFYVATGRQTEGTGVFKLGTHKGVGGDRNWRELHCDNVCIAKGVFPIGDTGGERGATEVLGYVESLIRETMEKMAKQDACEGEYGREATAIAQLYGSAEEKIKVVNREIGELRAVPLIPRDCEYIRRAVSPTYKMWRRLGKALRSCWLGRMVRGGEDGGGFERELLRRKYVMALVPAYFYVSFVLMLSCILHSGPAWVGHGLGVLGCVVTGWAIALCVSTLNVGGMEKLRVFVAEGGGAHLSWQLGVIAYFVGMSFNLFHLVGHQLPTGYFLAFYAGGFVILGFLLAQPWYIGRCVRKYEARRGSNGGGSE